MIYVDQNVGSRELLPLIRSTGEKAELMALPFGDFMFEGKGPEGDISIGIERKALHDMMQCINDHRFSGHQMPGMKSLYHIRILIVEGQWRPHEPTGVLMEGHRGGSIWGQFRGRHGKTMYAALQNYLLSVSLSGFIVIRTTSTWETASVVVATYHYFQKTWDKHTSLQELHQVAVPSLFGPPSLARVWAASLPGVGTKLSELVIRRFRTGLAIAEADEDEWLEVPGIGPTLAKKIFRAIRGVRA